LGNTKQKPAEPAHVVVGADAHIGPAECIVLWKCAENSPHFWADGSVRPQDALVFYGDSGEFAAPQRADVGIGPYDQVGKCIRIRRMAVAFCRRLPLDLLLGKKNA